MSNIATSYWAPSSKLLAVVFATFRTCVLIFVGVDIRTASGPVCMHVHSKCYSENNEA